MLNMMTRSKQAVTTPPAKPESVTIKPQRMGFEFGSQVPRYWLKNSPFVSHTMNALSVLFPQGEQFFVDSVRMFRDQVKDPQTRKEVSGFIGQEAMHSLEHVAMNDHVREQGMPVGQLEEQLRILLEATRKLPARHQLAITCALEHITAMMADMLLERNDVREDMDETMRPLWVWHAIEETEHKAVAFDLFQAVGGTYLERTAYHLFSTFMLGVMSSYFAGRMMWNDRRNLSVKDSAAGLWRMWGVGGVFSSLIPNWLDYLRPGFHPWENDNSELIARFRKEINTYAAPEYQKHAGSNTVQ